MVGNIVSVGCGGGGKNVMELISGLQADNLALQKRMQVIAVEMSILADCFTRTIGVQVLNKNSELYKSCHPADAEAAEIQTKLTAVANTVSVADEDAGHNQIQDLEPAAGHGDSRDDRVEVEERDTEIGSLVSDPTNLNIQVPLKQLVIRLHRLEDGPSLLSPKSSRARDKTAIRKNKKTQRGRAVASNQRTFCKFCQRKFRFYSAMKTHERLHTGKRPFKCSVCEVTFQFRDRLKTHLKTHAEERPHPCGRCAKSFLSAADLRRHHLTHTKRRPYACGYCGARFRQATHKRTHEMIHTGEKPFKCSFCDKSFSVRRNMESHITRKHTKERPYQCSSCERSSSSLAELKVHERTHTGEKPYACGHCSLRFSHADSRRRHEMIHTGKKPHRCANCKKSFYTYELKRHVKRSHTS